MGNGIDWMVAVALWVASLPGAVGRIAAFGIGPLMFGTAGLILLCLLRTPLRFAGAALLVVGVIWAGRSPLPDIRVSSDGNMVAVRNSAGRVSIMKSRNDDFTIKEWLAADGDARMPRDESLAEQTRCDTEGCVATLPDRSFVALSSSAEALAEDCAKAALVVSTRAAPPDCAALLIDRDELRASGALDIMRKGKSFDVVRANPQGQDRPWAKRLLLPARTEQIDQPASHDATPRPEDLQLSEP
jgi:competence protein ComEC